MKIIIKLLAGILYILAKYTMLSLATVLIFIWDCDSEYIKELWEDHNIFYKKLLYKLKELELYRYNTLWDYVMDNRDYSHKSNPYNNIDYDHN